MACFIPLTNFPRNKLVCRAIENDHIAMRISVSENTGSLDLSDSGLCEVPREVWRIKNLENLSLSGNNITTLPPEIKNLKQLRRLGLAGNRIEELPEEIGELTSLEGLWLHGNNLGYLPETVQNLEKLQLLALSGNELCDLPDAIGQLKCLQVLSVAGNKLKKVTKKIGNLQKLRTLAIYGNLLCSLPEEIRNLVALQQFWIQGNRLETLPKDLSGLDSLKELSLADNCLSVIPQSIGGLSSLQNLMMFGNHISNVPSSLGSLQNLRYIWLESNPVNSTNESSILSLGKVRRIGIDTDQAVGFSSHLLNLPNVTVGKIAGSGKAKTSGGYFKIQPWNKRFNLRSNEKHPSNLIVAFGSAPGVPNWGSILRNVRKQAKARDPDFEGFDVLFVVDPTRSWYTHEPLDSSFSSSTSNVGQYYYKEIERSVRDYENVIMLGDSMGASAALMFAPLANSVLAFCPQTNLCRSSMRPGRAFEWHTKFGSEMLEAVNSSKAQIDIHCGSWTHDVEQAMILDTFSHVKVHVHQIDDHRLAKALKDSGKLDLFLLSALGI